MATTIETYPDRAQWLGARSTGIGSSDAPVILGLSKWKSPLTLYYEKRGMRQPSPGEVEFVEWGMALEPAIIAGYERVTHRAVGPATALLEPQDHHDVIGPARFVLARDGALPFLVASPDATVLPIDQLTPVADDGFERVQPPVFYKPGVLEVKNVDISKGRLWEETQEPPIEYTVQVQHQLMVTGAEWASIAALVGGNRFMWADIKRDDELIAMLRKLEIEFWERCLNGNPPPVDGSESTKELLGRLYPKDTGEVVELPAEAAQWDKDMRLASALAKEAKALKGAASNQLKAALGGATVGVLEGVTYSWRHQTRRAHQVRESEFRVLRRHGAEGDEGDE